MARKELEIRNFKLRLLELGFGSFQLGVLSWFEFLLGDSMRDLLDDTNLQSGTSN
jgi:hypothetical protein